ncbi:MAG: hypothetical protein O4965_17800 [Trichodesmium sp. St19_bin1]|nr:hypothetical protein [Trichodesmium sp. St19_bin1]
MHARSLQGFGYGDVVHQFEKRCIVCNGLLFPSSSLGWSFSKTNQLRDYEK